MNIIYDVQRAIDNLRDNTIGLFKPTYSDRILMVVENERGLLKCVSIGTLGGVQTDYIPANKGKLHMFEDGKSLSNIMDDPFGFNDLIKTF